jgi:spore maturation protein CgeB
MRLLIHAHAYPGFLQAVYGERPELAALDYEVQFAALDRESHIGANSAWAEALRPLGYEVMVIVSNNERLQKTWADEHGAEYRPDSWQTEIAEAQVATFQPELMLFTSYEGLRPGWIDHVRETNPSVALLGLWCGMTFGSGEIFRHFDLVLTCVPELHQRFRALGCNSRHLHHAFDRRVLDHIDGARESDISLSFVGQLIRASDFHEARVRQLERIAETIGITIFSSAYDLYHAQQQPSRSRRAVYRLALELEHAVLRRLSLARKVARRSRLSLPSVSEGLRAHTRPAVYGLAMYRTLQRSRVSYNCHAEFAAASASNRRLFEATGVSSCLLTDHKPNISTLFEPGREVVTFSSTEDCIEKATWLLEHPRERAEIASAGQRRTLDEHTYAQRADELDSILKGVLKRPGRVPA